MNVKGIHNCFGCGVCATVCPKRIIDIVLNDEGFYEPCINDSSACIDCGLCIDVCSYSQKDLSLNRTTPYRGYAAWSKDAAIRQQCSSGGVGFEIGRALISEGYKVCGVRYNAEKNRAEHYIASDVEELTQSMGSKYIQSYTLEAFKAISPKDKYLITGTPCQIDSFRRYLQKIKREDNFVLLDFFCHGVPSKLMWDKYLKEKEKVAGKIIDVAWRDKQAGWHDSYAISVKGSRKNIIHRRSKGDEFYLLFLSDSCLGKACYEKCRFKYTSSSADIRIGDLWGPTFRNDEKGVSGVIAFTDKGDKLIHDCNCELVEQPIEVVTERQMKECPVAPSYSTYVWENLKNPRVLLSLAAKYPRRVMIRHRWTGRINHLLQILRIKYRIK